LSPEDTVELILPFASIVVNVPAINKSATAPVDILFAVIAAGAILVAVIAAGAIPLLLILVKAILIL
jgi:hypothetical protein